jgi:hypothetical protein
VASRRGEAGEGRIGCIFWSLLLIVGAIIAWQMVPVQIRSSEFVDYMDDQAQFAAQRSADAIKKRVLQKANDLRLPVGPNRRHQRLKLSRSGVSRATATRDSGPPAVELLRSIVGARLYRTPCPKRPRRPPRASPRRRARSSRRSARGRPAVVGGRVCRPAWWSPPPPCCRVSCSASTSPG